MQTKNQEFEVVRVLRMRLSYRPGRPGHAADKYEDLMPSLFRFLFVLMILGGMAGGTLYVLATYFEPEQKEISKPVRDLELKAR